MRTVWKYRLNFDTLTMTCGTPNVVHVGTDPADPDDPMPCVWIEHTLDEHDTLLQLMFIGTGHEVPKMAYHVGTCIKPEGLVWHVYAVSTPNHQGAP